MASVEGLNSDWSEGTFKMIRLHNVQELINYYKTYIMKMSDGKPNIENYYEQIKILRDEGNSKYNTKEIKECDEMEDEIDSLIGSNAPHKRIVDKGMGGYNTKFVVNKTLFKQLYKMIRRYEQKVKYFNDVHGLTTKNSDWYEDGL